MTLDQLIGKLGKTMRGPVIEIATRGDGVWSAYFQMIVVALPEEDPKCSPRVIDQPFFKARSAAEALKGLIIWLRGKLIRELTLGTEVPGSWVAVPDDLQVPSL